MPTVPRALRHKQNVTDSKPAGCVLPIPAGSPRPASAGGLGTSARRPPSPPVRRNPANPARAGRQAPRTATRHHATTWEKRPRESSPSRQSANAQVKRQAKRQTPPCPDCFIAGRSAPWPSECCDNGPLSGLPDVAFVPPSSVYEPIGSDGSHALPGPKVSTPPCHQRVADARSIERATQSRHPESADLCTASRPAAYGYPAGANSPSLMVFKSPLGHPER